MEPKYFEVITEYDFQSDILYISNTIDYRYNESIEMGNNLILDFNENDRPVALEILDASKFLKVKKYSLQHIKHVRLELLIDEDIISIKGSFIVLMHNKEVAKPFVGETINDINLPFMNTNFGMAEA